MKTTFLYRFLLSIGLIAALGANAQLQVPPTDSWADAQKKGRASISLLWYDIEPFIYRNADGSVHGVEYELMEGFKRFLKQQYNIDLTTRWVDAGAFDNIYPFIKNSKEKGLFGVSFYSITEPRKKDVRFSPAYMPDMSVLATNNGLPSYETDSAFIKDLPRMQGYTMKNTTMEEDVLKLKSYYGKLPVENREHDYEVLKQIAATPNSFGYVPLSVYVVALQKGIKIKRQRVLATRREGFAAIYTKTSDWEEPVNAYFNSLECRMLVAWLIRKYLGTEVADIILEVSGNTGAGTAPSDIELLTKEREIVTQRLIDTALDAERTKTQRNITIVVGVALLLLTGIFLSRFLTKNRLNRLLKQRNEQIAEQKQLMEELNQQLQIKILQSRFNPHFLFNSLNSIQYHISTNDKKNALQYISRFSTFLRLVLQSSDEMLIPAATEARLAEQYLWLEQNRFPDRFQYHINTETETLDALTPPLLIHTLLETVLYHHILNEKKQGVVGIDFLMSGDDLLMRVTDSAGTAENINTENIESRMEIINKAAVKPVSLAYKKIPGNNVLEITVPQPLFILKPQTICN